ncbi:DUF2463 domain-containing protein [Encephalitozoon intestinalis]|nr:DUF2463 domain-containing protein [Encephalitozoon intestinalis]
MSSISIPQVADQVLYPTPARDEERPRWTILLYRYFFILASLLFPFFLYFSIQANINRNSLLNRFLFFVLPLSYSTIRNFFLATNLNHSCYRSFSVPLLLLRSILEFFLLALFVIFSFIVFPPLHKYSNPYLKSLLTFILSCLLSLPYLLSVSSYISSLSSLPADLAINLLLSLLTLLLPISTVLFSPGKDTHLIYFSLFSFSFVLFRLLNKRFAPFTSLPSPLWPLLFFILIFISAFLIYALFLHAWSLAVYYYIDYV